MGTNTTRLKGEGTPKRDILSILCCQKSCDTITKGTSSILLLLCLELLTQENGSF